jgi:hypothetical protein
MAIMTQIMMFLLIFGTEEGFPYTVRDAVLFIPKIASPASFLRQKKEELTGYWYRAVLFQDARVISV